MGGTISRGLSPSEVHERSPGIGSLEGQKLKQFAYICLLCSMSVSVCMFALSTLRLTKFSLKNFTTTTTTTLFTDVDYRNDHNSEISHNSSPDS